MLAKDIVGLALIIIGGALGLLAWRLIGDAWAVFGMVLFVLGFIVMIFGGSGNRDRGKARKGGEASSLVDGDYPGPGAGFSQSGDSGIDLGDGGADA